MPRSAGSDVCPPPCGLSRLASQSFAAGGLLSRPYFLVPLPHPYALPSPTPAGPPAPRPHCNSLQTATCPAPNPTSTLLCSSLATCSSFSVSDF